MLNSLRDLVSWLDALLDVDTIRRDARDALETIESDRLKKRKKARRKEERKEERKAQDERRAGFMQNLLLTGMPLIVDAITKATAPKAPPRRVFGLEDERPVTIHRPRPSMDDAQQLDSLKDMKVEGFDPLTQDLSLTSVDERLRAVEMVLAARPCRSRNLNHATVEVVSGKDLPAWLRQAFDDIMKGDEPSPSTQATKTDKLDD